MEILEALAASRIRAPGKPASLPRPVRSGARLRLPGWSAGRWPGLGRFVKRAFDVGLSTLGLICLLPLLVAVAAAIRLDSSGTILFRQRRLGRRGREFEILKFRTMREDAEEVLQEDPILRSAYAGNGYKLPSESDPRITALGRFLRQTSMDELPQLLNVLGGEMSLVGPRPVVPREIREYGEQAALVLSVRPGMTGLWQVSGRNEIDYPRRAKLDAEYVQEWSLIADLRILLCTPAAVLRGEARDTEPLAARRSGSSSGVPLRP